MVDGNAGKGDNYRKVDPKKWDEGWESAFGKKKEKKMKFNNKVIDMTKIDINESNTIEIRSNRYPNTPIISSEGKKLTTTRTKIGIKYRPLLRKIFRTNV